MIAPTPAESLKIRGYLIMFEAYKEWYYSGPEVKKLSIANWSLHALSGISQKMAINLYSQAIFSLLRTSITSNGTSIEYANLILFRNATAAALSVIIFNTLSNVVAQKNAKVT